VKDRPLGRIRNYGHPNGSEHNRDNDHESGRAGVSLRVDPLSKGFIQQLEPAVRKAPKKQNDECGQSNRHHCRGHEIEPGSGRARQISLFDYKLRVVVSPSPTNHRMLSHMTN